jgi:hypothetical protein
MFFIDELRSVLAANTFFLGSLREDELYASCPRLTKTLPLPILMNDFSLAAYILSAEWSMPVHTPALHLRCRRNGIILTKYLLAT